MASLDLSRIGGRNTASEFPVTRPVWRSSSKSRVGFRIHASETQPVPDLSITVDGLYMPNPFVIGSGPPGTNYKVMKKAFDEGWGAVIAKTVSLDAAKVVNVTPRYARLRAAANGSGLGQIIGWQNIELISDRPLETMLQEFKQLKEEYPDRILIASIMEECNKAAWEELIDRVEQTGIDAIEINFSCPHGMPERKMGAAVGQDCELLEEVCGWINAKATVPVWAKMTPNITDITQPARVALKSGCEGVSAINTIMSVMGINLNTLHPEPCVEGYSTPGGYSAKAVHPIALGKVMTIAQMMKSELQIQPPLRINNFIILHNKRSISASAAAATMVKAIRVHELGDHQVLKWEDVQIGVPKDGEVRVKNKAVGLNFIDIYFRKGVYNAPLPFTPGMEAVGVVEAVGPGLTGRKVGDIVAYAGSPMGSYAEEQILPADKVVPVPPSIDPIVAASVMLKGMTAQFLVRRCFKVEPGHTVLVHAAAGGVGSLLCQWANALGATVIGTVSTEEKATQAKDDGCHHVILYKEEDFVTRVNEITSGKGVEVVYDSVGKDTFQGSLECLKTRGYMVSFGQSSGTPDPVPLSALAPKSLFLTRPSLMQYTETRDELLEAAGEVFANVALGVLRVRVSHTYPLSQAAQAHADLESRKTSGSIVLIPDGV